MASKHTILSTPWKQPPPLFGGQFGVVLKEYALPGGYGLVPAVVAVTQGLPKG